MSFSLHLEIWLCCKFRSCGFPNIHISFKWKVFQIRPFCNLNNMYRLVNLSRVPWDLVPSKARHQIEWRVKGLPTYLVHGSHQKLNSLYFYLFLKILLQFHSFHQLNYNHRQFLQKLNPQFSVFVIRKVCSLATLPVFWEHISKKS